MPLFSEMLHQHTKRINTNVINAVLKLKLKINLIIKTSQTSHRFF